MALKLGVIRAAAVANPCAFDPICPKRDYMVDATQLACGYLRLNCSFVWFNGSDYGDVDETTSIGTGLVGAIQRYEFDTSIPIFAPTYRRFKAISFGELFDYRPTSLVTRAPNAVEEEFDWSIVSAFHWQVWTLFFICLVLNAILISILHRQTSGDQSIGNLFFDLNLTLVMNEFKNFYLRYDRIRFLIGLWLFGAFVLSGAYTGTLFSKKIFVINKLPYTDLETFVQCLETEKCRIIASSLSVSYLQQLLSPDDSHGSRIRASFEYNPVQLTPSNLIMSAILAEKNRYLVNIMSHDGYLFSSLGNRNCSYYSLDLDNLSEMISFPYAKNSSHAETLNKITLFFR